MSNSPFILNQKINNLYNDIANNNPSTLLASNNTWTGTNNFNQIPTCPTAPLNDDSNKVATTEFVQSAIPTVTGFATLAGNNTYTGQNVFNGFCPQSILAPVFNDDLTNKLYVDNTVASVPVSTLQQVLTAGNTTDLTAEFRNNLTTPTYINTISSTGMSSNNDVAINTTAGKVFLLSTADIDLNTTNGDINLDTPNGVVNINGSAYPPSSVTTASNLAGGIASQIPYQSIANTTAFIANGSSGQYLKSNGTSAPSWATITIPPTPTLNQVLTAGSFGIFPNTLNMVNNTTDVATSLNGTAIEVAFDNGLAPSQTATYGYDNLTSTGNGSAFTIASTETLNLSALDTAGTGKGIFIDNTTPNIQYSTGGFGDFIRIANNGTITSQSVTNSLIADLSPNYLALQHPATQTAMDLDSDLGMRFSTASSGIYSNFSATQLQFSSTPNTSLMTASGFRGDLFNNTGSIVSASAFFPSFVQSSSAGYGTPQTFSNLSYTPSTKLLTCNINGNCAGTATNANNILVADNQVSANYYVPFVSGTSGQQAVYIDASSPYQYNPVQNLLTVGTLALNTGTTGVTFSAGALSAIVSSTGGQTTQEFKWVPTTVVGTMTTFNITNRRSNGIYRIFIVNNTGVSFTINGALLNTAGASNKTSFSNTTIANGSTWIMKIQVVDFNTGNAVNAIDLTNYA